MQEQHQSEFERIEELRRTWAARASKVRLDHIEPIEVPTKVHDISTEYSDGIRYQRCGGGRRVLRKAVSG